MVVAYMLMHTFSFVLLSALILFYIVIRIIRNSNLIRIPISFQFIIEFEIVRDFYSQQPIGLSSQAGSEPVLSLSLFFSHFMSACLTQLDSACPGPLLVSTYSSPSPVRHVHATARPVTMPTSCCAQEAALTM
jgi:hypothetical protein